MLVEGGTLEGEEEEEEEAVVVLGILYCSQAAKIDRYVLNVSTTDRGEPAKMLGLSRRRTYVIFHIRVMLR